MRRNHQWVFLTNSQWRRKIFRVMTSSSPIIIQSKRSYLGSGCLTCNGHPLLANQRVPTLAMLVCHVPTVIYPVTDLIKCDTAATWTLVLHTETTSCRNISYLCTQWLGDYIKYLSDNNIPFSHSQCHGCWCPGDARSQGINNNGIDLVLPEQSSLSTRSFNV